MSRVTRIQQLGQMKIQAKRVQGTDGLVLLQLFFQLFDLLISNPESWQSRLQKWLG